MFEQLNLPELNELEGKIAQLERERDAKAVEASTLRRAVEDAVVADINAEALAAHKGKRAPKPTEPGLRKELEAAERELAVLGRRVALAQSDRSRYIQELHTRKPQRPTPGPSRSRSQRGRRSCGRSERANGGASALLQDR